MQMLPWDQGPEPQAVLSYASSLLTGVTKNVPPWVMPFHLWPAETDYLLKVINYSRYSTLGGVCSFKLEVVFIELYLS